MSSWQGGHLPAQSTGFLSPYLFQRLPPHTHTHTAPRVALKMLLPFPNGLLTKSKLNERSCSIYLGRIVCRLSRFLLLPGFYFALSIFVSRTHTHPPRAHFHFGSLRRPQPLIASQTGSGDREWDCRSDRQGWAQNSLRGRESLSHIAARIHLRRRRRPRSRRPPRCCSLE